MTGRVLGRLRARPVASAAAGVLAALALVLAGPASPAAPSPAPRTPRGLGPAAGGLIAFQDAAGIGLLDPATGRQRLLLAVPSACTATPPSGASPAIELAGPVWAPSSSASARLYLWLTDWQYHATPGCDLPPPPSFVGVGGPILVAADPFTGALTAVAAAPAGLPCQPGADLAAVAGALAFTDGGCDEPTVEALALPLRPGEQPEVALPPPHAPAPGPYETVDDLLGEGPSESVLYKQVAVGSPGVPAPSLRWWSPATRAAAFLAPRPPRALWGRLVASATSPTRGQEAFAAGAAGAGVLDLATGAWSPMPLPASGRRPPGAVAVSFSPSGDQLAVVSGGQLLVDEATGKGSPEVLLRAGVTDASWSGPLAAPVVQAPPATLARVLPSLFASFAKLWGSGLRATWRVAPAATAAPTVSVASLPGAASALVMVSPEVALAAGTEGSVWRSIDGGRTWTTVTAHCAELQMVTRDFPPCDVAQMAALPGGTVLAGGTMGLWRSTDGGLRWQRQVLTGRVVVAGPFAAGRTAYLLVAAAQPNGLPARGGAGMSLLASTDGGRSWQVTLAVPSHYPSGRSGLARFFVLGPGRLAVLYRPGDCSLPEHLRVSTDGGRTWLDEPPPAPLEPVALAEAGPGRLVLGSRYCDSAAPSYGEGIFTRLAGAPGQWSPARLPSPYLDRYGSGTTSRFPASAPLVEPFSVAALAFPSATEGVAVGSAVLTGTDRHGNPAADPSTTADEDLILVSHDGGSTWSDAGVPGTGLELLSCAGPGHCLAAG